LVGFTACVQFISWRKISQLIDVRSHSLAYEHVDAPVAIEIPW
jgi:hypothetical protein